MGFMHQHGYVTSYLVFGVAILLGGAAANADPQPVRLEPSGALVGAITIENGSIFDLEKSDENSFFYRLANKAHATTRRQVIEQQLLFQSGDEFSSQALAESERILRGNRYLQEAQIQAVPNAMGTMDVKVSTSDTWTLIPKLALSHSGGTTSTAVGVKEMNLLGSGVGIEAFFTSDVDRDSKILKVVDRNIGDSWYSLKTIIEENSDGYTRFLDLGQSFYALDSTSAHGISILDNERIESLYDRGEIAAQYGQKTKKQELFLGWSKGLQNGWARRYIAGLGYDENRFSEAPDALIPSSYIPDDRKFVYPFLGIEFLQDKYEEATNYDQVARVEDRFLGAALSARVGFAGESFGSDRDALLIDARAQTSFSRSQKSTIFLSSDFSTRLEGGRAANTLLALDAKYYRKQSDKRLLYARLSGAVGDNLDLDQQMYLGGDTGLRGYPLRFQNGDKRALLTLEQRFFTDWYPFRLFHVGAAVFFDAGRTWGEGPFGGGSDGFLKDVGAGLRLGNSRSGLGRMIHIDVAYPLDGENSISNVQFIIESKVSF
jgi:hypothetical protein